jgi:hypothetical protein
MSKRLVILRRPLPSLLQQLRAKHECKSYLASLHALACRAVQEVVNEQPTTQHHGKVINLSEYRVKRGRQ